MTQIKSGDTVKVHYTGTLEDGSQFDSSVGSDPLEFTIGTGQLIAGFENCVLGMTPGEKKTVTIPPEEAYGEIREELILEIDKNQLPADAEPKVGLMLQAQQQNGSQIHLMITDVAETTVTVDANPPLAGKTLTFEIELLEVA
ncbi:peptidylprolyl isomerase [bacterium]|nr:peptidylprolyl isomerase [bacterium]